MVVLKLYHSINTPPRPVYFLLRFCVIASTSRPLHSLSTDLHLPSDLTSSRDSTTAHPLHRDPRVVESRRAKESLSTLLCIVLAAAGCEERGEETSHFCPIISGLHSSPALARTFEQAGNTQAVPPLRQPIKLSRACCRASGQRPAGQSPQESKRLFVVLGRASFLVQRQFEISDGPYCTAINPVREARTGSAPSQTSRA